MTYQFTQTTKEGELSALFWVATLNLARIEDERERAYAVVEALRQLRTRKRPAGPKGPV